MKEGFFSILTRVCALVAILVWSQFTFAQAAGSEKICTVTGKVVDSQGKPVARAEVLLQRNGETKIREYKTDASGAFSIAVPCDLYRVTVRKEGYRQKVDAWKLEAAQMKAGKIEMPPLVLTENTKMQSIPPDMAKEFQEVLQRMRQGNYQGSGEFLKKLSDLYPEDAEILYMLGVAYNKCDMPTEALVTLNRVIELRPKHAGALYEMGLAYHKLNQLQPALECYKKALRFMPNLPEINFNAGLIELNSNRPREALTYFDRALKAKGDDPEILEMTARSQIGIGAYPLALENLRKARLLVKNAEKIKELDTLIALIKARIE